MSATQYPVATLWRRLAAMFYDALLLIALWMVATALFLPITGGQSLTAADPVIFAGYRLMLVGIWVLFYGLFWTRRGQTLGMSTWRIRLIRADGRPLRWKDAMRRLLGSVISALPAGIGILWIMADREHLAWKLLVSLLLACVGLIWSAFDSQHLAWHDRVSGTRPVMVPKD